MKRFLILSLISLGAMAMTAPLCTAETKPYKPPVLKPHPITPTAPGLNILQLTSAEMYRYGREMYLRGNFTEASKVFLQILRVDCTNKVAQYHLRKIAAEVPSLAFLNAKLDKLPCEAFDFTKEDFLPASVYYEKDPDLILEQMLSHKNRYRLSEKEMAEKIDAYILQVKGLETAVSQLKNSTVDAQTLERLKEESQRAKKLEKEVSLLQNQLASQRLDRQKEVQDIRTLVAEAETGTGKKDTAFLEAVAQTKAALESKERSLAEKDQAIMTLQARFDDIQRRLKAIQNDLANKNAAIEAIQINLKDTQNP